MAWRIADSVIDGELDNTIKGPVTGWLRLLGRDELARLKLRLLFCHEDDAEGSWGDGLQRELDREAARIERSIRDSLDDPPEDNNAPE